MLLEAPRSTVHQSFAASGFGRGAGQPTFPDRGGTAWRPRSSAFAR
jgi:hypothetical protein